jgi:hypothetical protein
LSGADEQVPLLREILKWIRFSGMKEVKSVLNTVLNDLFEDLLYGG